MSSGSGNPGTASLAHRSKEGVSREGWFVIWKANPFFATLTSFVMLGISFSLLVFLGHLTSVSEITMPTFLVEE